MNILYWDWIENKTETLKHSPSGGGSQSWDMTAHTHTHAHTKWNGNGNMESLHAPLQSNNTLCFCCSFSLETFGESGLLQFTLTSAHPSSNCSCIPSSSPCWNIDVINNLLIDKCEVYSQSASNLMSPTFLFASVAPLPWKSFLLCILWPWNLFKAFLLFRFSFSLLLMSCLSPLPFICWHPQRPQSWLLFYIRSTLDDLLSYDEFN